MREIIVFGVVGVLATLIHYTSAIAFVELLGLEVLMANFYAYCMAVGVSYVGHAKFTFRTSLETTGFCKFLVVSLSALALSQLLLGALAWLDWLHYRLNLLVVVAFVPIYSFVFNKFWVYRLRKQPD